MFHDWDMWVLFLSIFQSTQSSIENLEVSWGNSSNLSYLRGSRNLVNLFTLSIKIARANTSNRTCLASNTMSLRLIFYVIFPRTETVSLVKITKLRAPRSNVYRKHSHIEKYKGVLGNETRPHDHSQSPCHMVKSFLYGEADRVTHSTQTSFKTWSAQNLETVPPRARTSNGDFNYRRWSSVQTARVEVAQGTRGIGRTN